VTYDSIRQGVGSRVGSSQVGTHTGPNTESTNALAYLAPVKSTGEENGDILLFL
jgi:hypothetical protein